MNAIVPTGNNALTPTSMESAIQLAEMMARGKLVPSHLHNSPGDCLMIVEQALRWQMSPFAVAQCTSVIQGKLMFEGKLVAAALNASGVLAQRLGYEFSGTNGQRAVKVSGTLRGETKPRDVTVFLSDAQTSNGMWKKQPDQQLVYAATRVWARRHAPEVMLGVYAPEEFDQAAPFDGQTLDHEDPPADARDALNRSIPLTRPVPLNPTPRPAQRAAAAATPAAPVIRGEPETPPSGAYEAPDDPLAGELGYHWLQALRIALRDAGSLAEVERIGGHARVNDALADRATPPKVRTQITELLADAYARHASREEASGDLPEVEIAGEEKVMAG